MPLVLPAGERIRRKSDCFRRLAVGERLPQRLRYRPEVNAVEKQLLLPDALPLWKGRCPRCPAVGERSLSPMPCRRRKCGCSLRTCRRRTVPWSLPLGKDRCFPMPCRWGKVVVPDAVGTACRGTHSPKERLLLKACRWGKLPPIPAIPPRSERSQKIAVASRCLPPPKERLLPKACRG